MLTSKVSSISNNLSWEPVRKWTPGTKNSNKSYTNYIRKFLCYSKFDINTLSHLFLLWTHWTLNWVSWQI